jgi:hypothetical protein
MTTVWVVFLATALAIGAGGLWGLCARGTQAPVFRRVGTFLLAMAGATLAFPALLPVLGPVLWAACYIALVLGLTGVMTAWALRSHL